MTIAPRENHFVYGWFYDQFPVTFREAEEAMAGWLTSTLPPVREPHYLILATLSTLVLDLSVAFAAFR